MATIDTLADRSTGSASAGKAYFETSTNKFIVFNGTAWIELDSDGTGAVTSENRWGASFDGSNDYLSAPTITALNAPTAFSSSVWFANSGTPSEKTIISAGSAGVNRFYLQVFNTQNIRYGHSSAYLDISVSTLNSGTWYHLVTVHNGTSLEVFLNGVSQGTASVNAPQSGYGTNFKIGGYAVGGITPIGHFKGALDDVAIFDTALDQTAVTALYGASPNAGIPSEVSGAIGYWRMGDDSSDTASANGSIATITDSSGNGNDATQGTASNQPTFKALAASTTSLSFDGSNDYLEKTFSSAPLAGAYTIGFWFNTSTSPSWLSLFESTDTTANYNGGFRVYRKSDGHIRLVSANLAGNYQIEVNTPSAVTSLNAWHYVVLTRSAHGASPELYVDGVVPSGTAYGTPMSEAISATKLRIGSTYSGGLTGYMDEVSFFNSELTGSDLTAYLSAARGTHLINDLSLSPTAYWRMGEDDSLTDGQTGIAQISDASGNGNHATQAVAASQPTASVGSVIYV